MESNTKSKWNGSHISVFWKDELTAEVDINDNKVSIKKYTSNPAKQFFLAKLGLEEYDPIEIVKRTFGVSYNDSIWFKFNESNITWKKLCPKGDLYV